MAKRIMHCIATFVLCTIIAAILALAMPREAHAIPRKWRDTPVVTQGSNTYRVREKVAVVIKTRGANVNIPAEIRYKGKWCEVKAIWPDALKGAKVITIHADLESCESSRPWVKGVKVRVTRAGMYRWFKRTGVNVTRINCSGCK